MGLKPSYKPMQITLIKRDKARKDLIEDLGISPSTLAKMSRGEWIALKKLAEIADYLDCQIEDIVEFVPNDK